MPAFAEETGALELGFGSRATPGRDWRVAQRTGFPRTDPRSLAGGAGAALERPRWVHEAAERVAVEVNGAAEQVATEVNGAAERTPPG